jgi:hypothetical protein
MTEIRKHRSAEPVDQALDAVAEEGVVVVDGPGGVAITLTSRAASDSARSMAHAAGVADEQGKRAIDPRR